MQTHSPSQQVGHRIEPKLACDLHRVAETFEYSTAGGRLVVSAAKLSIHGARKVVSQFVDNVAAKLARLLVVPVRQAFCDLVERKRVGMWKENVSG